MPEMKVIELTKNRSDIENMLGMLDKLKARVNAGEIEAIWVQAWTTEKKLISAERGKVMGRLEKIGMVECLKYDIINAMDSGDEAGL
jgi:hypothetical protein